MEQQEVRRSNENLITAVYMEDHEAVKNLLQSGSNVNQVNDAGNSPLHYAVQSHDFKMIQLLLRHNAQLDIENNDGCRPLDYAIILYCCDFIINILLQYKAEVRVSNISDLLKDDPEYIKKLLYENVNVEHADSSGYTALHHAVKSNYLNGIRTLISRGADVNKVIEQGRFTSLHLARSTECIKILLRAGAKPNVEDAYSCSPLCSLVMNSDIELIERKEKRGMIEELIRNGADCIKVIDYIQTTLTFQESLELRYYLEDVLRFMARKENEHHY